MKPKPPEVTERYFKLLSTHGFTPQRGFYWEIPNGKPGDWLPPIKGKLVLCENAYHVLTIQQLLSWPEWASVLIEVEVGTETITDGEKTGVRRARPLRLVEQWNNANLRLFAADCAKRVLHVYEQENPNDDRPRKAIQAARDFVLGKIDMDALVTAGADARAAGADATIAAEAVAWAAGDAARIDAWDGARAAARNATRAVDDAWSVELRWQELRLRYFLGIRKNMP